MSVQTTADKHFQQAVKHLTEAKQHLVKLLDRDVWGSEAYDTGAVIARIVYIEKILEKDSG